MGKHYKTLNIEDRILIERMIRSEKTKYSVIEIARAVGCNRSTIYNELKRGEYTRRDSRTWELVKSYSPEKAQAKCDMLKAVRGTQLKIGNNIKAADYLEDLMTNKKYSPQAALDEYKKQNKDQEYGITFCKATIYSYITKNVFRELTNKDLPVKGTKKTKYHRVKVQKRASAGTSIEERPADVETREEFGNWEIDTVIGRQKKSNALLTLTERKTRREIIRRVKDKSAAEVVRVLDELEAEFGPVMFRKIFKSITSDNGNEFAYCEKMEKSIVGDEKRTKMYYAHAYSSWERGTNEINNRMIRRWIPKGTLIDNISDEMIEQVEEWMNEYPRRIFDGRSAIELYEEEIKAIAS